MSNFNEADHPRAGDGKFTDKPQSAPEVALGASPAQKAYAAAGAAWDVAYAAERVAREASARAAALSISADHPDVTEVFVAIQFDESREVDYVTRADGTMNDDLHTLRAVERSLGSTLDQLRPATGVTGTLGGLVLDVRTAAALPEYTRHADLPAAERGARLVAIGAGDGDDHETAVTDALADLLAHAIATGLDVDHIYGVARDYAEAETTEE